MEGDNSILTYIKGVLKLTHGDLDIYWLINRVKTQKVSHDLDLSLVNREINKIISMFNDDGIAYEKDVDLSNLVDYSDLGIEIEVHNMLQEVPGKDECIIEKKIILE
jgi:hypothetical protein